MDSSASKPNPETTKPNAAGRMMNAAELYHDKGKIYGHSYRNFGPVLEKMFPKGLFVKTADDWNRLGLFMMIMHKNMRLANNLLDTDSTESPTDAGVYNFMMAEVIDDPHGQ